MQQKEQIWTVVRTFNRQELIVSDFLKREGLSYAQLDVALYRSPLLHGVDKEEERVVAFPIG